jgi:hypothetical protein
MRRNNEERLMGGHKPTHTEDAPSMPNPMDFVTPTEFVELPSQGKYPEGHPLHGKDTIEIRYMTAKDEDILTNRSLLKKGLALDRLIENVIVDKSINPRSLYMGDRNAIVIHTRASAYGTDYKVGMTCPACNEDSKFTFDLTKFENFYGRFDESVDMVDNGDTTYTCVLPRTEIKARFRLLNGYDEIDMAKDLSKKNKDDSTITKQMRKYIVDFNGYRDEKTINYVIDNMVATDSKYLRSCVALATPDVLMRQEFKCKHCEHEEEVMVPFGTEFFWPE